MDDSLIIRSVVSEVANLRRKIDKTVEALKVATPGTPEYESLMGDLEFLREELDINLSNLYFEEE